MKGFLLSVLVCVTGALIAQSKTMHADQTRFTTTFTVDPNQDSHEVHAKIKNISNSQLELMWKREALLVPAGTFSFICDNNLCYAPFASSCPEDRPNVIAPGSSVDIKLTYNDAGIADPAHIVVWVFEKEDTSSRIKLDFLFNQNSGVNVKNQDYSKVKVYPNPANTVFSIGNTTGISHVELYSLLGRKVANFPVNGNQSFDISNLAEGIYLVKLFNTSNQLVKTVRLHRRETRA